MGIFCHVAVDPADTFFGGFGGRVFEAAECAAQTRTVSRVESRTIGARNDVADDSAVAREDVCFAFVFDWCRFHVSTIPKPL